MITLRVQNLTDTALPVKVRVERGGGQPKDTAYIVPARSTQTLKASVFFELSHGRLGHPGLRVLSVEDDSPVAELAPSKAPTVAQQTPPAAKNDTREPDSSDKTETSTPPQKTK